MRRLNMTATRSHVCAANRKGWGDEPALKDTGFPKRIEFPHRDGGGISAARRVTGASSEFRANRAILAAPTPPGCVAAPGKTARPSRSGLSLVTALSSQRFTKARKRLADADDHQLDAPLWREGGR